MGQCLRDNEKLRQEVTALKQAIAQLRRENLHLKSQLPTNQEDVHILP
jgi:upstream stimulatory factor